MKFILSIFILFISFDLILAQSHDSVFLKTKSQLKSVQKDSSISSDTTSIVPSDTTSKKKTYDVDTVIYASSKDSLFFYVDKKKMDLFGNSDLKYKDTDLKSANISVNFVTHDVDASGVPNDSLPGKFKNTPVLSQGGEVYDGETMIYNFKTSQGYITLANTKTEGSTYSGEKIKKVDKNTFFIQDGIFTTCTVTPPHYYFYSPKMKVIQKREIDAEWIWLYFGGVPFPIPLPFGVFPLQSGRRSGIIPPAFGQDANYGFYFSHFGYFWAINDYIDLNMTGDYYTRGSFGLLSRFRYNKRYDYSGTIEAGYKLFKSESSQGSSSSKEWSLRLNHHENFTPTLRLDANLQFVSGKTYIENTAFNLNEALTNNIFSNATLSKTWDESGNSLSLSYSRSQDLESGNISEVLPSLTFNIPHQYPFKREGVFNEQKWYELVGFDYNGQFLNQRTKTGGQLDIKGGIQHNINASASPKIGYFNISPNISYTEDWFNKQIEMYSAGMKADSSGDSVVTNTIHKISEVRSFKIGVSASTKFYGIFQPNVFGISAIRQIVTPSISYYYSPDFTKYGWGYYGSYKNHAGQSIQYNKYQNEVFIPDIGGEQQNIGLSLGNVFEMKTAVDPSDTTSKEKKIQLLNLNAGINYNFAADSLRFSPFTISGRTQIGDWFNFNASSTFSLYDYAVVGQNSTVDINKFLINEGKGIARLTNFTFSVSTSLSGEKLKSEESGTENKQVQSEAFMPDQNNVYQGIYNNKEPDFAIPWSLSLSYNYTLSKSNPLAPFRSSNISGSLDFNLTKQWKFSVTSGYDFENKQFTAPQIRISRDLECWLMNFTWNPVGLFSGYYFEIRVKAPQLQDLKITKRGDFYNGK
ncbi:MAG: LPS-assembly protein LptD [Bacteroidetes bacterium]|nr:LPS-assembly protein LptD [Bacteroidota bacterium]